MIFYIITNENNDYGRSKLNFYSIDTTVGWQLVAQDSHYNVNHHSEPVRAPGSRHISKTNRSINGEDPPERN